MTSEHKDTQKSESSVTNVSGSFMYTFVYYSIIIRHINISMMLIKP